jgi:rhamnosyltransferase
MIGAIVVSYNPDELLLDTLSSLREQVDYLLLIDNGSTRGIDYINASSYACDDVVRLSCNVGVARAYNLGADVLQIAGCEAFIISDQDTKYTQNCLSRLSAVASGFQSAIVCPNVFDSRKNTWKRFEKFGRFCFRRSVICDATESVSIAISSGSYYTFKTFNAVGRFCEDLFIDYVDTEYCMRAGRLGIPTIAVREAIVEHSLGYSTPKNVLGKVFFPKNYSEFRRFYIYRNRVICWANLYSFGYMAWDLMAMANDATLLILFEDRKVSKILSSINGVRQAINYLLKKVFI